MLRHLSVKIPQFLLVAALLVSCSSGMVRKIAILETTDLHGVVFPYDYIEKKSLNASLANVSTYFREAAKNSSLILLDNGDNLQGQPSVYYYNYIDTVSPHINSMVMNYIGFDAGTVGNHDIEAGHAVYDRLRKEYSFPLLAANAITKPGGEPYFEPYTIIEKNGLRVAVLGLITPSVPDWLPPVLYSGMEFDDMLKTAAKWMPLILENNPDIVVGLFHSGYSSPGKDAAGSDYYSENSSAAVAYNIPGFDVIFTGHDHKAVCEKMVNRLGDTVLILNAGSHAAKVARADISVKSGGKKNKAIKRITGTLVEVSNYSPDKDLLAKFAKYDSTIRSYVSEVIGESSASISTRDSYFGSSAFVDMIHSLQLEITDADISFAAPLSFDVKIEKGPLTVGDMFKIYRFENMLYTIELKGYEVDRYLEYSYSGWFNTMKSPSDHLINFRTGNDGKVMLTGGKARLRNQFYNFDSAAGIEYTVDVSKPAFNRVNIISLSGGKAFANNSTYLVAVNSYRGSGGGGHLTSGVSLSREELAARLRYSTVRDLRYYIMETIRKKHTISPEPLNNWKIIPEDRAKKAVIKDYRLMFGEDK